MTPLVEALVTILTGVIGVAMLSVLVSKNSQTPAVLQAGFSGFSNALDTAISPVTGAAVAPNLSFPGAGFAGFALTPTSINAF